MKISVDRFSLTDAIKSIRSACCKKGGTEVSQALEGILVEEMADESEVKLTAYDLELGMQTNADLVVPSESKQFKTIIPPTAITAIFKLKGQQVHMQILENNVLEIVSGNARFKFATMETEKYPELPEIRENESIALPQPLLKSMIEQTIFAVSTDDYRPTLMGILFDITETEITAVALDGYRVATRNERIETGKNLQCIIPSKALNGITKLLSNKEEDKVTMHIGSQHVVFNIGEHTTITRTLQGQLPNYRDFITSNGDIYVRVNVQNVIESLDRASLLISHNVRQAVKCSFTYDTLEISCETPAGSIKEEIGINKRGTDVQIGLNGSYFLDALRATECDEVLIELDGELKPMSIMPIDGNSFKFVVMPMRLRR